MAWKGLHENVAEPESISRGDIEPVDLRHGNLGPSAHQSHRGYFAKHRCFNIVRLAGLVREPDSRHPALRVRKLELEYDVLVPSSESTTVDGTAEQFSRSLRSATAYGVESMSSLHRCPTEERKVRLLENVLDFLPVYAITVKLLKRGPLVIGIVHDAVPFLDASDPFGQCLHTCENDACRLRQSREWSR